MAVNPSKGRRYHHPSRLDGVPALAAFLSDDTDAAIFREFRRLGARNLLHLQNRVSELESRLEELDKEDVEIAKTNHFIRDSAKSYDELRGLADRHRDVDDNEDPEMRKCFKIAHERIQLHHQITNALHQYRQALIEAHQIGMLSKPSATALKTSQLYFNTEEDGKILVGYDATMLQDPEDLVALIPSPDDDRLSRLLRSVCGRCLQDRKRTASQLHSDIYYFPARRVQILSYSVSAIFCAVLLVGAMACLGAINQASWQLRIGMVALFTFLFATFVAMLTNAKRSEVFAATAAYAAVLVVYMSASVGSSGKQVDVALTGG